MALTYISIPTNYTYANINSLNSNSVIPQPKFIDNSSWSTTKIVNFMAFGYQYTQGSTPPQNTPLYAVYFISSSISGSNMPDCWLQDGGPSGTNNTHVNSPSSYSDATNVWHHLESGNITPMQVYVGGTATEYSTYLFEYDTVYGEEEEEEEENTWSHQSYSGGLDYYSITVNDNNKWIYTTYSYGSGYFYEILVNANSETNYDGVVVCTGSHSSGDTFSTMTGWSDHLVSATGHNVSNSTTFTPSSSGTLYIYFRTDTSTIYPTDGTTGGVQIWRKYKVTLNDNGGSGGSGTQAVQMGLTSNTMSVNVPTRGTYEFLGYYNTVAKTGGTQYIQNTGDGVSSQPITSNITLYARWKNTIYWSPSTSVSCTYSSSQQDVTIASTAAACASGGTITYTITSIKKGTTIQSTSGWSVNGTTLHVPSAQSTGTYTIVVGTTSPASSSNTSSTFVAGSLTKTITLTINTGTITLTLKKNDGTSGTDTNITVTPGAAAGSWSVGTAPTRTGYTFKGYYAQQSNTSPGTRYTNGTGTTIAAAPQTPTNLYAHWQPNISYSPSQTVTAYCTTGNHEASVTDDDIQVNLTSTAGSGPSGTTVYFAENNEAWDVTTDGKALIVPEGVSAGTYNLEVSVYINAPAGANYDSTYTDIPITLTLSAVTKYPNNTNPTKYKNTSGTTGTNVTYGTPTVSIGSGLSAGGGSATVSCSVPNTTTTWYWKYTNGTYSSQQSSSTAGSVSWSITTQTFTPTGGSASNITRFSKSSNTLSHTTMGTNVGTDYVKVTAVNGGDSSKTATDTKSISNTASTSTSTTYGKPTVDIGTGIDASGGSATVTCTVTNTVTTTTTYTSGATSSSDSTVEGTARWKITSNGNNRFSHPSSGGVSLSGVGTVYNSGTKVYHDDMTNNATTDTVVITAYNVDSTSKTETADDVTTNSLTWKNPVFSTPTNNSRVSLSAAGQTYSIAPAATQKQEYTSGTVAQTVTLSSSDFTYSVATSKDGYSLSSNQVTVTNNTSTSERNGFRVKITATKNSKTTTRYQYYDQPAGTQGDLAPVITGYSYSNTGNTGVIDKEPTVTYQQEQNAWNGVSGTGTVVSTGGTLAYTRTGTTPSGFSTGTNFATTGNITWANNTSTSTRDAKSNLKVTVTIGGLTSSAYTCTACLQSAGAKVYGTPSVTCSYSTSVSAGGATDLAPSLSCTQSYTWNGIGTSYSETPSSVTYSFTRNPSGYTYITNGTNFATTGKINVASRGTTIDNARNFYNAVKVSATANGVSSTAKYTDAGKQNGNYVTAITPKSSSNTDGTHFSYANIGAGATSASPSLSGGALYTFSSGDTKFDSSGSPSFGGSATYTRTYSLGTVQNGFTAVNSSTGVLTATARGTTIGEARTSGTVTSNLVVTYTHPSGVSGGTVTSSTKSSTATCTQNANAVTSLSLTVGSATITYNGTTSATVTATFSSGDTLNVSNDSGTTYSTNPTGIVTVTKS